MPSKVPGSKTKSLSSWSAFGVCLARILGVAKDGGVLTAADDTTGRATCSGGVPDRGRAALCKDASAARPPYLDCAPKRASVM